MLDTFCEQLDWEWCFAERVQGTHDRSFRLCYGTLVDDVPSALRIKPSGLLAENGVTYERATSWQHYEGVPCPEGGDPLAGAFYLLSCYEEYSITALDLHSRVPAKALSLVRQGHARYPVVDNLWLVLAKALLEAATVEVPVHLIRSQGYSSFDVDAVYALSGKPVTSWVAAGLRHLAKGRWKGLWSIVRVGVGKPDPFDQFEFMRRLHVDADAKPLAFLLMGYGTREDPAWEPTDQRYESLIKDLAEWTRVGVHPSYYATENSSLIAEELGRLSGFLGYSPFLSRQHFLRIKWPKTFQQLIASGIQEDYSLGWPDEFGFRAGTARSFRWFDLSMNAATKLSLHPFHAMDVTGRDYLGLSPKQFISQADELRKAAAEVNAGLRIIWHNSNLGPLYGWEPYREVYRTLVEWITNDEHLASGNI